MVSLSGRYYSVIPERGCVCVELYRPVLLSRRVPALAYKNYKLGSVLCTLYKQFLSAKFLKPGSNDYCLSGAFGTVRHFSVLLMLSVPIDHRLTA